MLFADVDVDSVNKVLRAAHERKIIHLHAKHTMPFMTICLFVYLHVVVGCFFLSLLTCTWFNWLFRCRKSHWDFHNWIYRCPFLLKLKHKIKPKHCILCLYLHFCIHQNEILILKFCLRFHCWCYFFFFHLLAVRSKKRRLNDVPKWHLKTIFSNRCNQHHQLVRSSGLLFVVLYGENLWCYNIIRMFPCAVCCRLLNIAKVYDGWDRDTKNRKKYTLIRERELKR